MMRMRMRGGIIGIIARGRRREHAKARRYRRVLRKTLVVGGIIASFVVVVVVIDALASVVVDALASVVVVVGVSIVLAVDDVLIPPLLVYSRAAIESRLASRRWRALLPPPSVRIMGGRLCVQIFLIRPLVDEEGDGDFFEPILLFFFNLAVNLLET
jgi:hypothetical protein